MSIQPPTIFNFVSQPLRVVMIDDNPWFVAADVCAALDIANTTQALTRLDADEQALYSNEGIHRGDDQVNIINESGLYSLILGSRKPEAKKFKKWVTSEVLPAIRKTGHYIAPQAEYTGPVDRYVDLTSHPDFRHFARMMEHRFWYGGSASHAVWANLRKISGGHRATAFPESQIPAALEELKRLEARANAFFNIKSNFERSAIKWVFGTDAQIIAEPQLPGHGEQLRIAA